MGETIRFMWTVESQTGSRAVHALITSHGSGRMAAQIPRRLRQYVQNQGRVACPSRS
jgi:hypothetical protein